jgi:AsmA protein
MNKLLKWILGLVVTLAILLVIISVVLPLLLDPNNYKDEISEAVKQRTGRELAINGDISWRVFPSVGLQISDMSLANRAGFGTRPMLEIAEAAVSVKLQPLFNRQLEVSRVDLKGVMAYLRSNTDGRNNWEDLAGRGGATTTVQELPADLEIQISSADISLENTTRRVTLDGFNSDDSTVAASQGFDLAGRLKLEFIQQEVAGDVSFVSLVQAVRGKGLIGLQDLEFTFSGVKGPADDTLPLELQSSSDMVVDLGRDQAELTNLVLQFFSLRAEGAVNVTSLSGEPEYSGRAAVAEFNPRQLMEDLGLEAPKTGKTDALSRLSAEMNFNGSSSGVDVPEMAIVMDDSTLEGQLHIAAFEPLQLAFDMNIDTLNLDDYSLLVEAESTADEDIEVEGAGLLVGSMLLFSGGGDLGIGRLVTGGLTAENVTVTVTSNADELRLFPISSTFYGGQHQGDLRVGLSNPQPVLTVNQVISGFDTATLLNDLAGTARLHGTGDVYLKISTVLGNSQQTRQSLSGDVGLSIMNGVIDDVDIPGAVDKVTALLGQRGGADTTMQATQNMEFAELIVTGIISRGILKSDDLLLSSALVNATGEGAVNLVNETVDYTIHPVLVGKLAAQMPADYRDISIPVRITGQMWEPNVSLDIAAGITASQRAKMANKAGEVADALLQGLSSKKKDKQ